MYETPKSLNTAVKQANWLLVNRYLQQFFLGGGDKSKGVAPSERGSDRQTQIKSKPEFEEPEFEEPEFEIEFEQLLEFALQVLRFGDFQERWEVAKIFPRFGNKIIASLLTLLEDEEADLESRWFAIRILGKFDQPEVVISLANVLREAEEEDLCAMAATALANIGISAIVALSELLQDEKSKLLAVRSLAIIRRIEIIDPLKSVVKDPTPEVRAVALEALGSFHKQELIPLFIEASKDTSALVRKEAVVALGMRRKFKTDFDIINHLIPLLHDLNPQVCQQSVLALGRMEDDKANEALFLVLMSAATPIWLQQEIVRVLNWGSEIQSLSYLEKALYSSEPNISKEIITVLGYQDSFETRDRATKILIDFFKSKPDLANQAEIKQAEIKQAIATSLGELKNPKAMGILQQLASDKDPKVKLHAIAALKKIAA